MLWRGVRVRFSGGDYRTGVDHKKHCSQVEGARHSKPYPGL
jgi:hypothetical protein